MASMDQLSELRDLMLLDANRAAEIEYPGFVAVEHGGNNMLTWCVGDANGDWGADLQTIDGADVRDAFTIDGSASWPMKMVADAIADEITKREH